MKISELIEYLQAQLSEHGDIEVMAYDIGYDSTCALKEDGIKYEPPWVYKDEVYPAELVIG